MKSVSYTKRSAKALRRISSRDRERIMAKIDQLAEEPAALVNNITELKNVEAKRLRIGDWRVIFGETDSDITILDIGPRGSIYGR